jgi:tRNA-Thr(GGU) m(6)t(6)A37 methyltransferase TsaA
VETSDDHWGDVVSEITLDDWLPAEALDGLETFSHLEIIYHFHLVAEESVVTGARHPRDNPNWPLVGIFAQRGKSRPNRLGATIVRLLRRTERMLIIQGLDAVEGTPVLDIKPVMVEFLPREPVTQPAWVAELMQDYWCEKGCEKEVCNE